MFYWKYSFLPGISTVLQESVTTKTLLQHKTLLVTFCNATQ